MAKWLVSLLVAVPFMSTVAFAGGIPGSWDEIMKDPTIIKSPTAEEVRGVAVQPNGDYQLYKMADRFAFLFDPQGQPIVAFDLTMNHYNVAEALLGGVGIGEFSLLGLWKLISKNKKATENMDMLEAEEATVITATPEQIQGGIEAFRKMPFKAHFAQAHGYMGSLAEAEANGVSGFEPMTFGLNDVFLPADQEAKVVELYSDFGKVFYGKKLDTQESRAFMGEFTMQWDADQKQFHIVRRANPGLMANKRPPMPEWVLNYSNPLDNLQYKYALRQIENTAMVLETFFAQYAKIFCLIVSHATNNIKIRMDAHENLMLSLLEAAARDEYQLSVPLLQKKKFLEQSIDMIYLSKLVTTKDITNGGKKRKEILQAEAKAREATTAWLAKKGYTTEVFPNQRFARVFKGNKEVGIANVAIKPMLLTKQPFMNYYNERPWMLYAGRLGVETIAAAARIFIPTNLNFGKWLTDWLAVSISVYIPGAFWDTLIQGTKFVQIAYEGEIIGLAGEQLAGNYSKLSYSKEDLEKVYRAMYKQRVNPFELTQKEEPAAKTKNYKDIENLIGGGLQNFEFRHAL